MIRAEAVLAVEQVRTRLVRNWYLRYRPPSTAQTRSATRCLRFLRFARSPEAARGWNALRDC